MKETQEARGITQLAGGEYTVEIRGPEGQLCLDLHLDLRKREAVSGRYDDAMLRELLVVTSVAGGWVEGEMHRRQKFNGEESTQP